MSVDASRQSEARRGPQTARLPSKSKTGVVNMLAPKIGGSNTTISVFRLAK